MSSNLEVQREWQEYNPDSKTGQLVVFYPCGRQAVGSVVNGHEQGIWTYCETDNGADHYNPMIKWKSGEPTQEKIGTEFKIGYRNGVRMDYQDSDSVWQYPALDGIVWKLTFKNFHLYNAEKITGDQQNT